MIRKLRLKFICVNMLIVTLMLIAIFGMVYHLTRQGLETQSEAMLQSVASDAFHPNRPGSPPQEVHLPFFVLELDGNGGLTASGGGYYDLTDQEFLKTLADAVTDADAPAGVLREYSLRYCRSVTPRGERIAFADMSSERATLKNLTETCAAIGVLCFAAFLLISWLLARWAVKPVETAWQQQRQFVADASHELKTPLTVILANTGILLSHPQDSIEQQKRWIQNTQEEAVNMKKLVDDMLFLAKSDAAVSLVYSEVNFSDVVWSSVLPFESVAFEQGLSLDSDIAENMNLLGDEGKLRELVRILLDNACKYCAPKGKIFVRLEREGEKERFLLSVKNTVSEKMSEQELERMFERFYRADKARNREKGGYGLGLAIAKSIVDQHHGKISASYPSEDEIAVNVQFRMKEQKK